LIFAGRNEVNLLDQSATFSLVDQARPDFIIHTAAKVGGISYNINQNYQMLNYNLTVDLNVINASIQSNVPNFVYFSSSCVYPTNAHQPFEVESIGFGDFEPSNENYAIAKSTITKLLSRSSLIDLT
jgi:GDP-L-fucose synthase